MSGGKRRPSVPMVSSDEEDNNTSGSTNETSSPGSTSCRDCGTLRRTTSNGIVIVSPSFSLDHPSPSPQTSTDFESPCSPSSSTSSGPVYIRPPGFRYHAQEILRSRTKKKRCDIPLPPTDAKGKEQLKRREPTPPKYRQRRDPLPMRLRAFPQSFWQQPNRPYSLSPAAVHSNTLPPLLSKEEHDIETLRPVTPPHEREVREKEKLRVRGVGGDGRSIGVSAHHKTIDNFTLVHHHPDLMQKLFDHATKKVEMGKVQPLRGRSKKGFPSNKPMLRGEDPYLVDTVTEKLFPHLSLENVKSGGAAAVAAAGHGSIGGGGPPTTSVQLITLRSGDKAVTLPSLCIEQNYSQMLTDLVSHI